MFSSMSNFEFISCLVCKVDQFSHTHQTNLTEDLRHPSLNLSICFSFIIFKYYFSRNYQEHSTEGRKVDRIGTNACP